MALDNIQDKVPINGTLVTMGIHGKVALAEQIYDDYNKDFQSNINKQLKEDIENARPELKTINGESLLGEGDIKVAADVDLSSYYTKTESDKKYITQQKLDGELQPYDSRISKLETDINNKEDKGYGITDAAFDGDSYELQIDKTRDSNGVSTQTIVDLSSVKGDINAVDTKVNNINKRIDSNGNASFTTLKVANKEVLPIIIINGDASGSGALTEYDKLNNAIQANDILFIKVTINSNVHILPLRWVAGNQGSYHLYFELPKIGADGTVIGYTSYKREIKHIGSDGYGGWVEDSWTTRESICTVTITQVEYDALTTKEDVLYVIKG